MAARHHDNFCPGPLGANDYGKLEPVDSRHVQVCQEKIDRALECPGLIERVLTVRCREDDITSRTEYDGEKLPQLILVFDQQDRLLFREGLPGWGNWFR